MMHCLTELRNDKVACGATEKAGMKNAASTVEDLKMQDSDAWKAPVKRETIYKEHDQTPKKYRKRQS